MSSAITPFEPQTMAEAKDAAKELARSHLAPKALWGKPEDVLLVIWAGREFGLGAMQSLRGIEIIEGKPVLKADLMVALAVGRKDVCEYFTKVESTADVA